MGAVGATLFWAGWSVAMPLLLLALAGLGLRHDRFAATALALAAGGFVLQASAVLTGWPGRMPSLAAVAALTVFAAAAFGFRLWRDRRLGHVRSTVESVVVLAIGAVFVFAILSLPTL